MASVPATIFGEYVDDGDGNITYQHIGYVNPAKQAFKSQCDINTIIDKAKRTGVLSHVTRNAQFYADMTEFDYEEARNRIAEVNSVFYGLDAETRREFNNNPGAFLAWTSNKTPEQIIELMPHLAEPGRQLPDVRGGTTNPAAVAEQQNPAPATQAGDSAQTQQQSQNPASQ